MFNTIFYFEIRQQLKKVFTWVFLLLMILQGVYYMHHTGEFYSADKTYANAPAILYTVLAGMGYLGFIVTAILGGAALGKDIDSRTAPLLYTTRAKEAAFFWGRYAGSLVLLLLLFTGYLIGIVLYNFLPVPNLGPFSWTALLRAALLIFLPNVFILYSLCFAASVFFKSSKAAYGVALTGMLLMIFAETSFDSNANMVLADPTAFSVLHSHIEHLSPAGKNSFSPAFSGLLLYNRLIWLAISLVLLLLATCKFSFTRFGAAGGRKAKKISEKEEKPIVIPEPRETLRNKIIQHFSLGADWKKVFSLSWLEFKSVIRPVGFKLFLSLILIIYICYIAVWQQQYYSAAPTLPVTLNITGVTLPLSFYFLLFLIINTTELLFKNTTSGFWQIGDALPVPSWVTVLSKIVAMLGVAILLTACLMLFGMMVQSAKGYFNFEPGVYFRELFIHWLPKYFVYILLTVFVAGVTANRYATHWITILFLIFSVILHETDTIEQNRLNFMFSPGGDQVTDMNGSDMFGTAHAWFMSYWSLLSLSLLAVALGAWQRGNAVNLIRRIKGNKRVNPVLLAIFLAGLTGFFLCGKKIYRTVNIENRFQAKEEERAEKALYEKTYKQYRYYPQPLIQNVALHLNLFPESRKLNYTADLQMRNTSNSPMDTLHVEWMDFSSVDTFSIKGYALAIVKKDTALRHTIYKLNKPLLPEDSITCHIAGRLQYQGFTNGDPQKELTFNGSFLSDNIIPYFGYDDRRELKENQYRGTYGLTKLKEYIAPVSDTNAAEQLFASTQADKVNYTLCVSTSRSQHIAAPGILKKQWAAGNRDYYLFESASPDMYDLKILSANYKETVEIYPGHGNILHTEVYYYPGHAYNVEAFIKSSKDALDFLNGILGAYPYSTLRIVERPHYDEKLTASGNMIILPENHGWIADIRKREDMDYLHFITTKLIAEQYFRQLNISRTQGYSFITESIPGYLALVEMEKIYGKDAVDKKLEKDNDNYLKARAKETNNEPSLLQASEDADYVSDIKGPMVLYKIGQLVGEDNLNNIITQFYREAKNKSRVNACEFYNLLEHFLPANQRNVVERLLIDNNADVGNQRT